MRRADRELGVDALRGVTPELAGEGGRARLFDREVERLSGVRADLDLAGEEAPVEEPLPVRLGLLADPLELRLERAEQ